MTSGQLTRAAEFSGMTEEQISLAWAALKQASGNRSGDRRLTEVGAYRLREAHHNLQRAHERALRRIESLKKQLVATKRVLAIERDIKLDEFKPHPAMGRCDQ